MEVTAELVAEFVAYLQASLNKVYAEKYPASHVPILTTTSGSKNIRIVKCTGLPKAPQYVFGFINAENGDILKAAGWKAPAKGRRGLLHDRTTWNTCHSDFSIG